MNQPQQEQPPFHHSLEEATHREACQLVRLAAGRESSGQAVTLPQQAAEYIVSGLFVTLKDSGKLRSCFGTYGSLMRLGAALPKATHGAATSDPRFPPITVEELPQLHLELSLLYGLQPITSPGEKRVAEVEIGKHGLEISHAGRRGLLLPRVAVDHGLDALGFLQLVCKKAGLEGDAWPPSEAKLVRFQSHSFGGNFV